jgi:ribonuclease P protein component
MSKGGELPGQRATLRRRERLGGNAVAKVLRVGRRWEAAGLRIVWCANKTGHDRLAAVVPRTVGSAVKRNVARRRLREVFRTNKAPEPPFCDIVLIARGCGRSVQAELEGQFRQWRAICVH